VQGACRQVSGGEWVQVNRWRAGAWSPCSCPECCSVGDCGKLCSPGAADVPSKMQRWEKRNRRDQGERKMH